jgi:hypothetical protein
MSINFNGKLFRSAANVPNGEVDESTIFRYHQQDQIVWADYSGGKIIRGQMIGIVLPDGRLEFRYQHVNGANELMTGICISTPEILADGRLQLHEDWQWTCHDFSTGKSIVEEMLTLDFG